MAQVIVELSLMTAEKKIIEESLQIEKQYQTQLEQDAMEMLNLQTRHFEDRQSKTIVS